MPCSTHSPKRPRRWQAVDVPKSSTSSLKVSARSRRWRPSSARASPTHPTTCAPSPAQGWFAPDATAHASTTTWPATRSSSCGQRCAKSPPSTSPASNDSPPPTSATDPHSTSSAATELAARLRVGDLVVLDVRPEPEFRAGHIAGARSIPMTELRRRLRSLPNDVDVVAYCRGPYCVYADDAVRQLRRRGYRATRLEDGFPEWKRAGLAVAIGTGD